MPKALIGTMIPRPNACAVGLCVCTLGLGITMSGCAGTRPMASLVAGTATQMESAKPPQHVVTAPVEAPTVTIPPVLPDVPVATKALATKPTQVPAPNHAEIPTNNPLSHPTTIQAVGHREPAAGTFAALISPVAEPASSNVSTQNHGTLEINGRRYQLQLVADAPVETTSPNVPRATLASTKRSLISQPVEELETLELPAPMLDSIGSATPSQMPAGEIVSENHVPHPVESWNTGNQIVLGDANPTSGAAILDLNLPSALAMIDSQHPAVGAAQWRVQAAYANYDRARVLWLPTIQAGLSVHRHDGNYQASNGDIVDVNRNSFQYGLGAGATGAGTTPQPGLVARFHLADTIFAPQVAQKTAWARSHAATTVVNEQLLAAAQRYNELLDSYQEQRVLGESIRRTEELAKLTKSFADAGEGLQADADRMQTETLLQQSRAIATRERIHVTSARLAQTLSLDHSTQIIPLDPNLVPIELTPVGGDAGSLVMMGLSSRPELKESQSLVAAACERYKREKYAPFLPSVLLGYSTGGFGGGLGGDLGSVDGRYDFDAAVLWQVRNLGYGERAARCEAAARVQSAKYEKLQVMDRIAGQINEAAAQANSRRQQISICQQAIVSAEESYQRNLSRIKDGEGLPIEVLQSIRALEEAQQAYRSAIASFNESQYALQFALGWPSEMQEIGY